MQYHGEYDMINTQDLRFLLVSTMTTDMMAADVLVNMMGCDMSPDWADGAMVFLTPQDVPVARAYIEEIKKTWKAPRKGHRGRGSDQD